ncbi:MAG: 2-oxoacid:acceptor oxidoreductase family protein [Gammaproteobacteria bacterium]|nr:2-oxoacid:acceptor oxidoreductase family protein [Gammaproteobacteria bacterium]
MPESTRNSASTTSQIRFGGVGGQGIVLAGRLLGKAAALFDGKEAVCTQTYGPEARGGASRADVIISDSPVDYPFVTDADILAVLFQEAYTRFRSRLKPGGTLIVDTGLVQPSADDENVCGLPATKIAEDLGSRLATNVVILGYLVGKTGVVSRESVEAAIRATVKKQIVDLDLKALDAGMSLAQSNGSS